MQDELNQREGERTKSDNGEVLKMRIATDHTKYFSFLQGLVSIIKQAHLPQMLEMFTASSAHHRSTCIINEAKQGHSGS